MRLPGFEVDNCTWRIVLVLCGAFYGFIIAVGLLGLVWLLYIR